MIETNEIIFEKGWMLKGEDNLYSEHKTRKEAREYKSSYKMLTNGKILTLYKYFKVINKDNGSITLVMTRSS
ncbi:hypothetical protein APT65_00064 [Trabzonvirus APT65]|uniref:Uncharacterized protein n=1 Tax=Aeromonas phage APT65 TaxID=2982914 RepID=A0A9E8GH26_9CAUD|nr:hypothetical protein APT65_00064 [Aeromonas phage APT65]